MRKILVLLLFVVVAWSAVNGSVNQCPKDDWSPFGAKCGYTKVTKAYVADDVTYSWDVQNAKLRYTVNKTGIDFSIDTVSAGALKGCKPNVENMCWKDKPNQSGNSNYTNNEVTYDVFIDYNVENEDGYVLESTPSKNKGETQVDLNHMLFKRGYLGYVPSKWTVEVNTENEGGWSGSMAGLVVGAIVAVVAVALVVAVEAISFGTATIFIIAALSVGAGLGASMMWGSVVNDIHDVNGSSIILMADEAAEKLYIGTVGGRTIDPVWPNAKYEVLQGMLSGNRSEAGLSFKNVSNIKKQTNMVLNIDGMSVNDVGDLTNAEFRFNICRAGITDGCITPKDHNVSLTIGNNQLDVGRIKISSGEFGEVNLDPNTDGISVTGLLGFVNMAFIVDNEMINKEGQYSGWYVADPDEVDVNCGLYGVNANGVQFANSNVGKTFGGGVFSININIKNAENLNGYGKIRCEIPKTDVYVEKYIQFDLVHDLNINANGDYVSWESNTTASELLDKYTHGGLESQFSTSGVWSGNIKEEYVTSKLVNGHLNYLFCQNSEACFLLPIKINAGSEMEPWNSYLDYNFPSTMPTRTMINFAWNVGNNSIECSGNCEEKQDVRYLDYGVSAIGATYDVNYYYGGQWESITLDKLKKIPRYIKAPYLLCANYYCDARGLEWALGGAVEQEMWMVAQEISKKLDVNKWNTFKWTDYKGLLNDKNFVSMNDFENKGCFLLKLRTNITRKEIERVAGKELLWIGNSIITLSGVKYSDEIVGDQVELVYNDGEMNAGEYRVCLKPKWNSKAINGNLDLVDFVRNLDIYMDVERLGSVGETKENLFIIWAPGKADYSQAPQTIKDAYLAPTNKDSEWKITSGCPTEINGSEFKICPEDTYSILENAFNSPDTTIPKTQ